MPMYRITAKLTQRVEAYVQSSDEESVCAEFHDRIRVELPESPLIDSIKVTDHEEEIEHVIMEDPR